ncbi:MAG: hypothetical protein L7H18_01665 [Candidatus Nealsonbacteria bacterium DGGOD1a]|nr:MAG: hypothetical protein L7H18_01665 [Candidatus Nealsonbacteria bacterium DGGOD1a]
MANKIDGFAYWAPRILSIMFVLFLALFSLDVFEPGKSFAEVAAGLLVHNIPVLLLAAVVAISWKREIVGGITFILAGIFYIVMVMVGALKNGFEWYMASWFLTISAPAFLIGALFLWGWHRKRMQKINSSDKK